MYELNSFSYRIWSPLRPSVPFYQQQAHYPHLIQNYPVCSLFTDNEGAPGATKPEVPTAAKTGNNPAAKPS